MIVVGSGSAGAVVARRLVDRGDVRVLLLEAGGLDTNPAIHDPRRVHELWLAEEDWAYETTPQPHAAGRRLPWPRGRVLGGSSCLNAMVWVRGAPQDFDTWAYLGADGWSWRDVLPVYERIERREPSGPGTVSILSGFEPDALHVSIVEAAGQCGIPFNADYNGASQDGISYMQYNIEDGVRHSTAAAYIHPVEDHPNLEVLVGAHARRLLFDGTRCVGVEWSRGGKVEQAHAGEVVVSGGTIGSPQLLLLSGVGPADHLRAVGVDVVADVPGVGENLHDHVLSPVIFSAEREIGPPSPGLPACQTHLFWRSRRGRARARHPADPFHGADVRGLDGRPGERLHAAGRDRAAREPRLDPAQRTRQRRSAADRPERPRPARPTWTASSRRWISVAASARPTRCARGAPSSATRGRTSSPTPT